MISPELYKTQINKYIEQLRVQNKNNFHAGELNLIQDTLLSLQSQMYIAIHFLTIEEIVELCQQVENKTAEFSQSFFWLPDLVSIPMLTAQIHDTAIQFISKKNHQRSQSN